MKKVFLSALIFAAGMLGFSGGPDYGGANGEILFEYVDSSGMVVKRKVELTIKIEIAEFLDSSMLTVYKDASKESRVLAEISNGDVLKIKEQDIVCYRSGSSRDPRMYEEIWYKVEVSGCKGWICVYDGIRNNNLDPFNENAWEILEEDVTSNKFTVRKLEQIIALRTDTELYSDPDMSSKVICKAGEDYDFSRGQLNLKVIAITQQKVTLNGETDHWVKVEYKGEEGWIFGGYLSNEAGGPKYAIPDYKIKSMFSM